MKKKFTLAVAAFISIVMLINLWPVVSQPASAASLYLPDRLDGGYDEHLKFYYDSACLVNEYWEDSYYTEGYYTKKNGAARVDGKWYLPAGDFDNYKSNYTYNGKKMISLDYLSETGLFEIDSSKKEVTVDRPYQMKRLIVKMKKGKLTPRLYGAVKYARDEEGMYVLQFSSEEATKAAYDKLIKKTTKVDYVEADRYISMIEPESLMTGADNQAAGSQGYGSTGWENTMLGTSVFAQRIQQAGRDRSVRVAIVDTGIDYTHPYLNANISSKGYDFINNDYDAYDDNSHGTHVAGIVLNVMSGTAVDLLPVKVLSGSGSGTNLTVANGIRYAADNGADVINLSLGGESYGGSHSEDQAISYAISKGATVVVAAGNESSNTAYCCPAHNADAIVVAAVDSGRQRAYFSNYGATVDVAAPGVDIYSSIPNGRYDYYSGTSMATPHVSGIAALLKKVYPDYGCSGIEKLIIGSCVDTGSSGRDDYYGYGIPDLSGLSLNDSGIPSATPKPTQTPVKPTSTPAPTRVPTAAPTYIPIATPTPIDNWDDWWKEWENIDWDNWPTSIPVPTATPKPTQAPVKPTATPKPTQAPVKPTATPKPTQAPLIPTATPKPTQAPLIPTTAPKPTQAPIYTPGYGDTSTSISTSSSSVNGVNTATVNIKAGSGVKSVIISVSDGSKYEYTNSGSGISKNLTFTGNKGYSYTAYIYCYDYYNNLLQSTSITF